MITAPVEMDGHTCEDPVEGQRPCRTCQKVDTEFGMVFPPWLAAGAMSDGRGLPMLRALNTQLDAKGMAESAWFTSCVIGRILGAPPEVDRRLWTPQALGAGWDDVLKQADAILAEAPGNQDTAADMVIEMSAAVTNPAQRLRVHAMFASIGGAMFAAKCSKYERMAYLMLLTGYPGTRVLGNSAQRLAVARPGVALGAAQIAGLFAAGHPNQAHAALTRILMDESEGYLLYVLAHAVARPLDPKDAPGIAIFDANGDIIKIGTYEHAKKMHHRDDPRVQAATAAMKLVVKLAELGDDDRDHEAFDEFILGCEDGSTMMFGGMYTLAALFSEEVLKAMTMQERRGTPG